MEQYINKSAAVAVIEKFMYGANLEADIASTGECFDEKVADAKYQLCKQIRDSIDSIKVKEVEEKEVDLKKEIDMFSMDLAMKENDGSWEKDIAVTAKHFFELGLKARKG